MAPQRYYQEHGPSPWVPVTILGVIVLVVATARFTPDASQFGYQTSGFSSALIWIPVSVLLAAMYFGSSDKSYRYEREGMWNAPYGSGGAGRYGDSIYHPRRGGYSNSFYDGYNNNYYEHGFASSIMDYGGLWLLILLAILLFSMVGTDSSPAATTAMAASKFSSLWSIFSPRPQYVIPLM